MNLCASKYYSMKCQSKFDFIKDIYISQTLNLASEMRIWDAIIVMYYFETIFNILEKKKTNTISRF